MPDISSTTTYTSIGLTVFMAVVLLFGFLLGIIRGWKKSTLRFGILVGVSVIVLLFMPLILKVSTENISIQGQSLQEYIATLIETQMPETANVIAGTITGASALALAAIGSIVFLGLFIVIQILTWIIFGICKLFLRKNKTAKKRRFIGGLIGLVQGLFVCFVFMIPVAGFTNIVYNVADAVEVVITEMQNVEEQPNEPGEGGESGVQATASVVIEGENNDVVENEGENNNDQTDNKKDYTAALNNIAEIKKVASTYRKSMPGAIYGIGKLDVATFNYLSQAKVGDTTVKLSNEIDTLISGIKTVANDFDLSILLDVKNKDALIDYLNKVEENQELKNGERLFKVLADMLFDSDVVKAIMVDSINNLSSDTEKVLNSKDISPELREKLNLDAEVVIERISVSNIDWAKEKTTFSKIMNNVLVAVLDYMNVTDDKSTEGSGTMDIEKLPLEKIGEALDGLKEMQLVKNIFNPGLKRVISVEKLIEERKQDANDPDTTIITKKTISQYVLENTKFTDTSNGIDLDLIKDYNDVVFADLMASIKKAAALKNKINGDKFEVGVGADLAEVMEGLSTLPKELKDQLNDVVKELVKDVKIGDFALGEALQNNNISLIESAGVIAPLVDVATVVMNVNEPGVKVSTEDVTTVVNSIKNIASNMENLSDENRTALNNLVGDTVNALVGEGTEIFQKPEGSENYGEIIEDLVKEADIIEVVLNAQFVENAPAVATETIVSAIVKSEVVADLLVSNDITGLFETTETQTSVESALKEQLPNATQNEINSYLSLFNFKTNN